jgi:catechol 2,3-dioxygenase-like lactoylglutathione lyase family enzyme
MGQTSRVANVAHSTFDALKMPHMYQRIAHIALVVKDYDEAIRFYTEKLGFTLKEDTKLSEEKRWVLVAPPGAKECCLLLAKAATEQQLASVGNQTGGRVFLFLFTDDFWRDYNAFLDKGVQFVRPPKEEAYGVVAVFADLYGNLWDLIQPEKNIKGVL